MYSIREIVGISEESYSLAVQNAVSQATKAGLIVHFFEVIQHRGAVKDGKISEFQAVVKVGGIEK